MVGIHCYYDTMISLIDQNVGFSLPLLFYVDGVKSRQAELFVSALSSPLAAKCMKKHKQSCRM